MDIIKKLAEDFSNYHFNRRSVDSEEIVSLAQSEIYKIDNHLDKIKFLNIVLERNAIDLEKHKIGCTNTTTCREDLAYANNTYFLTQELNRLGVQFNDDSFTSTEKNETESKLDKILQELKDIKDADQLLYDEFVKEINELRDLYYLGKKKWYQLLVGKGTEMVAGGIVSETVAKQVIETVKISFPHLLGN
jgi:hypothetical protein